MYNGVDSLIKIDDFETLNIEQYTCPNCNCTDRDRLYSLYINKKIESLDKNKSYSLLEFAPSESLGTFIKKKNIFKYRTADLFMNNVDDKVDITEMSIYKDNSFDCFICSHVLEHVVDDKKALKELYRITKPSGWGICIAPINLKIESIYEDETKTTKLERWKYFGQDDHVRVYSKNGFKERLKEAGFRVKEYGKEYFGDQVFIKSAISLKSVIYIVEKNINVQQLERERERFFNLKEYKKEEKILLTLTNYEPSNHKYFFKLGKCYMNQENYDEALESFSEAIELGLINSKVFYEMGVILEKIGEIEISSDYYQKSKELRKLE